MSGFSKVEMSAFRICTFAILEADSLIYWIKNFNNCQPYKTLYFLVRHSDQHLDSYPAHDGENHHKLDIFIGDNIDTLNEF